MASPPQQTRRIVTGHDADGKAIFESDTVLTTCNPFTDDGSAPPAGSTIPGFTVIHKAEGYPAPIQGPVTEYHSKIIPLVDESGSICRIVDFPPIPEDAVTDRAGLMHRTQSLDFAVVLKGTIKLELDDGVEKTVKEGDVVVQRGTIHSWKVSRSLVVFSVETDCSKESWYRELQDYVRVNTVGEGQGRENW